MDIIIVKIFKEKNMLKMEKDWSFGSGDLLNNYISKSLSSTLGLLTYFIHTL